MIPLWYKDKEGSWKVFPHNKLRTMADGSQYLCGAPWLEFMNSVGCGNIDRYCVRRGAPPNYWVFKEDFSEEEK